MVDIRAARYLPGSCIANHTHEACSFTVVVSGGYTERIRGEAMKHASGSMLFYPAWEDHSQQFDAAGAHKLIFTPDPLSLEFISEHGFRPAEAPHVRGPLFSQLARRVVGEVDHSDCFSSLVIEGLVLELVAAFARCKRDSAASAPPRWLLDIRELLSEEVCIERTNEVLARLVDKHPVHLARAFRCYFGETIGEYKRRLKISKAESLLRQTRASLTEIALECGFASHAHFSRSFKLALGVAPSTFRSMRT